MKSRDVGERAGVEKTMVLCVAGIQRIDKHRISFWRPPKTNSAIRPAIIRWSEPRVLRPIFRMEEARTFFRLRKFHVGLIVANVLMSVLLFALLLLFERLPTVLSFFLIVIPIQFVASDVHKVRLIMRGRKIGEQEIVNRYIEVARELIRNQSTSPPPPFLLHHNDYPGLTYKPAGDKWEARFE